MYSCTLYTFQPNLYHLIHRSTKCWEKYHSIQLVFDLVPCRTYVIHSQFLVHTTIPYPKTTLNFNALRNIRYTIQYTTYIIQHSTSSIHLSVAPHLWNTLHPLLRQRWIKQCSLPSCLHPHSRIPHTKHVYLNPHRIHVFDAQLLPRFHGRPRE